MKRILFFVALVLGVVSCQSDLDDFGANVGGEQEVIVNVSLPEETRANSAEGGISNVIASNEYTVRYIFQVYNADGTQSKEAVKQYSDDKSVSFPVRLVPNRDYRFVVWADIVKESDKADLHYNTSNFPEISLNATWEAMDETRDAYTVSEVVKEFNSTKSISLTLKRPLAKLRVITTDMEELLGLTPKTATVTYVTEHYNTFNALQSVVGDSKVGGCKHENYTIKEYETTNGKVLFTDYFFAKDDVVKFNMSVAMSDDKSVDRSFNTDIPVKRNYLTTLIGDILTEGNNITVNVEEGFDNNGDEDFDITYPIEDANTLAAVLTSNNKHINATLGRDIDLPISSLGAQTPGSGEYKLGGENTETITIDLNGKTLNITTTYWSAIGAKNENALFTIKNGKMTSSQPTGTWNSYDLTFANCDYVFEDVIFEKAIALSNVGEAVTRAETVIDRKSVTMKNVTINETHDYYAMWITAEGQTVNIENLTINSLGRGIKIDEQYVDAPAKVTLNIDGADFNTKKKAAIMVKSVAGADITLSNVDIADVAGDKVNAVWVDEDAANTVNKVNVIGGSMVVEGVASIEGETTEDVQAALNAAVTTENAIVQLPAGEYTFPKNFAKGVTVICEEGTVFNGKSSLNINGATVMGATFQSGSDDLVAYYSTINGTYKNCVFNGDVKFSTAGDTVVFENCVFNGPDYALHFDTAVAGSHVILKGCEVNSDWRVAIGAAVSMFEAIDTKFTVAGFINLWGKAKFTNCAFNKPYYWICSMDYTEYTNCTCEGRALVADDIRIEDTVIKINDEFYASNNESLKLALEKNASVVNLLAGNYELSGLNFVANNVTLKGVDKANVVLNLENSIYLQNKSVTLENLTYNLNAGKGYTEQAFAFVHHATAFNLKNCNVNRLRLNVYEANIEDCTFTLDTSSGFDGYCIYYYGNDNSTVNVKNSTFATAGKGICIYSEYAKAYNLNVDKCSFTSSDSATDKAAIQMHTELGIFGNVKITETTANGFADINGGLWNELNNNTKVATDKFDIWVDGTQVH